MTQQTNEKLENVGKAFLNVVLEAARLKITFRIEFWP